MKEPSSFEKKNDSTCLIRSFIVQKCCVLHCVGTPERIGLLLAIYRSAPEAYRPDIHSAVGTLSLDQTAERKVAVCPSVPTALFTVGTLFLGQTAEGRVAV